MDLNTIAIIMLAGGVVLSIIGAVILSKKTPVTILIGCVLLFAGLGTGYAGYDRLRNLPVEYKVTEITDITTKDDGKKRVTLQPVDGGAATWIYVDSGDLILFPEGETVEMTKSQLTQYMSND